jgi:hypothetical protein
MGIEELLDSLSNAVEDDLQGQKLGVEGHQNVIDEVHWDLGSP